MTSIPRLRIFAGPNGSGKSTMKSVIKPELLGFYINPDDIEKQIVELGILDLRQFKIQTTETEILQFFENSTLIQQADLVLEALELRFLEGKLSFHNVNINSYFASVIADFIRQKLLVAQQSFTFETVMSAPDKVKLLANAQKAGYRTYLYFVATEDPYINISRVKQRVKAGGHNVPEDKIISRYYRSLDLLMDAIKQTNRAYIFDNSNDKLLFIAEITDAHTLNIKADTVPAWFKKFVLDKISNN